MKVEIIDCDSYKVFINGECNKNINVYNKEELGKYVKDVILKLRKIYKIMLQGLYEVHVYVIGIIGIVLEINNIDSYLSKTVDLKIVMHNDEDVFIKVFRDELIEGYNNLNYYNNCFYFDAKKLKEEDIYKFIENIDFIYGEELSVLKGQWFSLT